MGFDVSGDLYDRFMGRYSLPLAQVFADWLGVVRGQRALDVGCGPGALAGELVARLGASAVSAIDPSASFVAACRERCPGVEVQVGVAEALPYESDAFDVVAANLVVHFMPDPIARMAEMRRVARPGGVVGATVWDLAGGRAPMSPVWRELTVLAPERPDESHLPGAVAGQLASYVEGAGLRDVDSTELTVSVSYPSFEEWWEPYQHGVGPIGATMAALDPVVRESLKDACHAQLGEAFTIEAVAFAARGRA